MENDTSSVHIAMTPLTLAQASVGLKPGEVARGIDPHTGAFVSRVVGRVPYDGATRQQRRFMKRSERA